MPRSFVLYFPSYGSESCGSSPCHGRSLLQSFPAPRNLPSQKDCLDGCFRPPRPKRGVLPHPGQFLYSCSVLPSVLSLTVCPRLYTAQLRCLHPPGIQSRISPKSSSWLIRILPVSSAPGIARKVTITCTLPWLGFKRSRKLKRRF